MKENKIDKTAKCCHENGSLGWLREQTKKDGFDSIRHWNQNRIYQIKNIDIVKNILEENKIEITDIQTFYRFWSKVDIKNNVDACWNWMGSLIGEYGQFTYNFKSVLAHRVAYKLSKGNISVKMTNGLEVQHYCNNRICCNPNHLELGDKSKNMHYMFKCNRDNRCKGINSLLGLAEDQIDEICNMYKDGDWSEENIGDLFGISTSTVRRFLVERKIK